MHVLGLQIGVVEALDGGAPYPQRFVTATRKVAAAGPLKIARDRLAGDEQADIRNHGGPDKALLCYGLSHYVPWREELGLPELGPGGFGENLTLDCTEDEVAVGDRWRVGTAVCEVSQPRVPCWKQSARWQRPHLTERMQESGRTGWYLRVLEEGEVWPMAEVEVLARPWPELTLRRCNEALFGPRDPHEAGILAACPALAVRWRDQLLRRAGD